MLFLWILNEEYIYPPYIPKSTRPTSLISRRCYDATPKISTYRNQIICRRSNPNPWQVSKTFLIFLDVPHDCRLPQLQINTNCSRWRDNAKLMACYAIKTTMLLYLHSETGGLLWERTLLFDGRYWWVEVGCKGEKYFRFFLRIGFRLRNRLR